MLNCVYEGKTVRGKKLSSFKSDIDSLLKVMAHVNVACLQGYTGCSQGV
jgi:hypothetical protein